MTCFGKYADKGEVLTIDGKYFDTSYLLLLHFKNDIMARYSKSSQKKVERAMHEMKKGDLKSGSSGKTVKSRKQAIAIGLSEARKQGSKVPAKKRAKKSAQ
jgi:hypothetical protein